jgi:hypothetical protein
MKNLQLGMVCTVRITVKSGLERFVKGILLAKTKYSCLWLIVYHRNPELKSFGHCDLFTFNGHVGEVGYSVIAHGSLRETGIDSCIKIIGRINQDDFGRVLDDIENSDQAYMVERFINEIDFKNILVSSFYSSEDQKKVGNSL